MSTLRQIMQRLAESRSIKSTERRHQSADDSELLKCHVDEYQYKLETCTAAMLQYEWAWLREHIDALELCLTQPEMRQEIGGERHVYALLEESKEFQVVLEEMFRKRMVHPVNLSFPVSASEHAWEISQETVRRAWGID